MYKFSGFRSDRGQVWEMFTFFQGVSQKFKIININAKVIKKGVYKVSIENSDTED